MGNRTLRFTGLVTVMAMIGAACTVSVNNETTPSTFFQTNDQPRQPNLLLASHSLENFDACDDFLDYVITNAVDLVGPYGLENPIWGPWPARGCPWQSRQKASGQILPHEGVAGLATSQWRESNPRFCLTAAWLTGAFGCHVWSHRVGKSRLHAICPSRGPHEPRRARSGVVAPGAC